MRISSYARSSSPWWQSQLAPKGHCHVSVSALRFFWNISVVQTITWKHLKPQDNGLKIQVSLYVMSVLRKANKQLDPPLRQDQSSGASCWQCCVSYERSPEEHTPSPTAMFLQHPKQLLLFSQGWVVALLWLLSSAKCWRALKRDTTIVLSETWSIFLHVQKTSPDMLRWAKIHLRLLGTIQPVQITVNAYRHVRNAWHD